MEANYTKRRAALITSMRQAGETGLLLFVGNIEVPSQGSVDCNGYSFRQDSSFLYFFGVDEPRWAGIIDIDTGEVTAYANDLDLNDIIWTGPKPSVKEQASLFGIMNSARYLAFDQAVKNALEKGRAVHFLPPLRYYNLLRICEVTGCTPEMARTVAPGKGLHASEAFVKAVIAMRLVKDDWEVAQLDLACDLGYCMHEIGRRMIRPGANENDVCAAMDGIAKKTGWGRNFETIVTQHGERLHGNTHSQILRPGKLLLIDAGLETFSHYGSDHTRTYPTSGKFTQKQREVYQIVCDCNGLAFSITKPGITYREVHLATARKMLEGLSTIGLVHGDLDEMVNIGIAGLFQPHGIGHALGLDSHDMEDLGEDLVGYDPDQKRSEQLGLGNLRMARRLVPGNVVTDEPGIYFIPGLIEQWKQDGTGKDFVNFDKLASYYDFGGIRLEDDILVTEDGARYLGTRRLPIQPEEVENIMEYHTL